MLPTSQPRYFSPASAMGSRVLPLIMTIPALTAGPPANEGWSHRRPSSMAARTSASDSLDFNLRSDSLLQVAEPLDTAPDLVEALQFSTRSGAPMRTSGTAGGS